MNAMSIQKKLLLTDSIQAFSTVIGGITEIQISCPMSG